MQSVYSTALADEAVDVRIQVKARIVVSYFQNKSLKQIGYHDSYWRNKLFLVTSHNMEIYDRSFNKRKR